ncbi:MAG TPA: hypothetical protein VI731_06275, partial [Bacteroidia bacterium]|nr:hypothetical protein [Bacteroidia bacterium]
PLLNDNNITGARYVLLNIVSGSDEITMDELGEITDYIQEAAGQTAEIIKGYGVDTSLGESVSVTIIATGFHQSNPVAYEFTKKPAQEKIVLKLEESKQDEVQVKAESKPETVNPLEPFLVNKQPEPVSAVPEITAVLPVAEPNNPLEPFLKTEEVVEEKQAAPVAETNSAVDLFPITIKEEKVAEEKNEEIIFSALEEAEQEIVATMPAEEKEEIIPVVNANVAFEITNLATEETATTSEITEQPLIVDEIIAENSAIGIDEASDITVEYTQVPTSETANNPVAETTTPEERSQVNEPVLKMEPVAESTGEITSEQKKAEEEAKRIASEEIQRKAQERIQRLKELSLKLKTPQGLNEMEHEPAYKRRNIQLDNVPHSSESQISRFTLSENEEKKTEIRPNNSFLHDNVD